MILIFISKIMVINLNTYPMQIRFLSLDMHINYVIKEGKSSAYNVHITTKLLLLLECFLFVKCGTHFILHLKNFH